MSADAARTGQGGPRRPEGREQVDRRDAAGHGAGGAGGEEEALSFKRELGGAGIL